MNPQALGVIARPRNISELVRRTGMSREGLYRALSSDGNPSFATVMKISPALYLRIHFDMTGWRSAPHAVVSPAVQWTMFYRPPGLPASGG